MSNIIILKTPINAKEYRNTIDRRASDEQNISERCLCYILELALTLTTYM